MVGSVRGRAAVALTLVIFAGVVVAVSLQARVRWRDQVLAREGEVISAVVAMQREVMAQEARDLGLAGEEDLLVVALHTWKLRGVLAVRLFDADGAFVDALPGEVDEATLVPADLARLTAGRPVVRFHPRFELAGLMLGQVLGERVPLLEVAVPVAGGREDEAGTMRAVIQYWTDGSVVAAEFARLDRELATQAGTALLVGGLFVAGSLLWAFRRVARAQRLLEARAQDLAAANRELAQAARSAAIGTITAHLMHGLRNPLAGLEGFVAGQGGAVSAEGGEWASARESTRRLRAIIEETLGVLRDVEDGADFDLGAGEMGEQLSRCLRDRAGERKVALRLEGATDQRVAARAAGVGGLALVNIVQNAIEASPAGGVVTVVFEAEGSVLGARVRDEGPGLPEAMRVDPFRPRRSTKPGGAGVGLALSRELARHAGGELELVRTGPAGTEFRLKLPRVVEPVVKA